MTGTLTHLGEQRSSSLKEEQKLPAKKAWSAFVMHFASKVIFTRLSHSQTLTHLAVLSIAVEPVAMAAE